MAKQVGIIKLVGMIDDLVFYGTPDDGYLARGKSHLTREKIKSSPAFKKTMDNAAEFAEALRGATFLRRALHPILFPIADGKLSSRMNRILLEVVQRDRVNSSGERVLPIEDLHLLTGFEFNRRISLKESFAAAFSVSGPGDDGHCHVDIPSFVPVTAVNAADYVKEVRLLSGGAVLKMKERKFEHIFYETHSIPLDKEAIDPIRFSYPMVPMAGEVLIVVLGIQHLAKVDDLPKDAISRRKYWKVRKWRNEHGLAPFTGALSIVLVMPGEAPLGTGGDEWEMEGLGLA